MALEDLLQGGSRVFCSQLIDLCLGTLGVDGAGLILRGPHGRLYSVAASPGAATALEAAAAFHRQGPGPDCLRAQSPVVVADPCLGLWPVLVRAAGQYGIHAAWAVPVYGVGELLGALSLYRLRGDLDEPDLAGACTIAGAAGAWLSRPEDTSRTCPREASRDERRSG